MYSIHIGIHIVIYNPLSLISYIKAITLNSLASRHKIFSESGKMRQSAVNHYSTTRTRTHLAINYHLKYSGYMCWHMDWYGGLHSPKCIKCYWTDVDA